jgi:3'-phosphoadenosine 5'-phosphosulfate sulfotransferase (PAPS reductase)/FAD synthetase
MTHFKSQGQNVVVSVSGGRTSMYIVKQILESNNGAPDNMVFCFQNTGKEREATLEFLRDAQKAWDFPLVWLEYTGKKQYKHIDFDTASRNGEPFAQLIKDQYHYLPNPMQRFCSAELKNKVMSRYLADELQWSECENWIGIRWCEPKRFGLEGVSYEKDKEGNIKYYKRTGEPKPLNKIISEEKYLPLRHARITKSMIIDFWNNNAFDLQLDRDDSNCDLCPLKGVDNILTVIRRNPSCADWWIEQENISSKHYGKPVTFHKDRLNYTELKQKALNEPDFFIGDNRIECVNCTD